MNSTYANQTIDFSEYRYILAVSGNTDGTVGQTHITPVLLLPSLSSWFCIGNVGGEEYHLEGSVSGKTITFKTPTRGTYRIYGIK